MALGTLRRGLVDSAQARAEELERAYRVAHPYYHHDLVPGRDVIGSWGPIQYTVRTNSLGFRDATTREVPKLADAPRILLIGDSFIEGLGVEYDATAGGLLAKRYAVAGIELLNAGVATYSPAIYWKKIEYLLERRQLQFDVVIVFLDPGDIQDEAWSYRIDSMGRVIDAPRPVEEPEMQPPISWRVFDGWTRNSLTRAAVSQAVRSLWPPPRLITCPDPSACQAAWAMSAAVMDHYGRDGLRKADEHMTRLAALLRAHRIPLAIVVYPYPDQLFWNDRSSIQVSYWQQWAGRERADFIDLFTPFFAEADSLGTEEAIRRYFFQSDVHWNERGHRLVAESVARQFDPLRRSHAPLPPAPLPLLR